MNAPVDTLPLLVTPLHFTLRALEPVRLPPFTGSTLRGAIGRALRTLTCRTGAPECDDCPHLATCGFARAWLADSPAKLDPGRPRAVVDTTPAESDEGRAGHARNHETHASPPYLITPPPYTGHPTHLAPGDCFGFRLHLLGPALVSPDTWEAAVRAAALSGLAEGRGRLTTTATHGLPAPLSLAFDTPWRQTVQLDLLTPLHVKSQRQRLDHFDPVAFTRRLLTRVEHLLSRYGRGPGPFDADALTELAASVPVLRHDITPVEELRQSDRQGRIIPITGIVGRVLLADVPRPVRQLWALAETLHAGKGAPMGLGHVRMTASS